MHDPGSVEPEGLFSGLRAAAIGFGVLVDQLLTAVTSLPLVLAFGSDEIFSENEALSQLALEELFASTEFLVVSLIVGLACTTVGAFAGARRAGAEFLRHGGWIAVVSVSLGLVLQLAVDGEGNASLPLWVDIVGAVLLLPAGLLGGALAARVAQRDAK